VNQDFKDLLAALLGAEARFLVVGAHALAVHGVPRATGDLDVWIARDLAVPFLGRVDLVRNKRATGRTQDRADLEALGER
jgi:hypothetical protein